MENIVKVWNVIYKHPFTNEIVNTIVYATSKKEATRKAIENNVPTNGNSFFYEIISVEEKC